MFVSPHRATCVFNLVVIVAVIFTTAESEEIFDIQNENTPTDNEQVDLDTESEDQELGNENEKLNLNNNPASDPPANDVTDDTGQAAGDEASLVDQEQEEWDFKISAEKRKKFVKLERFKPCCEELTLLKQLKSKWHRETLLELTGTGTGADTDADTGIKTGLENDVDTDAETDTDTGIDADADTGTDTSPDTGADTNTGVTPNINTNDQSTTSNVTGQFSNMAVDSRTQMVYDCDECGIQELNDDTLGVVCTFCRNVDHLEFLGLDNDNVLVY